MRTVPALKRSLNVWRTPTVSSLLLAGCAAASRLTTPSSSACAWAAETPGFRRAKTVRLRMSRRCCCSGVGIADTHSSALVGNLMPGGITPMTVAGSPLTRIGWPSTPRSPR